jgi:hypothetical protein
VSAVISGNAVVHVAMCGAGTHVYTGTMGTTMVMCCPCKLGGHDSDKKQEQGCMLHPRFLTKRRLDCTAVVQ